MNKAKSSFDIENGVWKCLGGGGGELKFRVCAKGIKKNGEVKERV